MTRRAHPFYQRIRDADAVLGEGDWYTRCRLGLYNECGRLTGGIETSLYAVWEERADAVKIGHARDPIARAATLQIGNPAELMLVGQCPGTKELEAYLHVVLAPWSLRGEWFSASPETLGVVNLILAGEDIAEDMATCGCDDPADSRDVVHHVAWDFFEAAHQLQKAA